MLHPAGRDIKRPVDAVGAEAGAPGEGGVFFLLLWGVFWGASLWMGILAVRKPHRAPHLARFAWALTSAGVGFSAITVGLLMMGLHQALSAGDLPAEERAMLEAGGLEATLMSAALSFVMLVLAPLLTAFGLTVMSKRLRDKRPAEAPPGDERRLAPPQSSA